VHLARWGRATKEGSSEKSGFNPCGFYRCPTVDREFFWPFRGLNSADETPHPPKTRFPRTRFAPSDPPATQVNQHWSLQLPPLVFADVILSDLHGQPHHPHGHSMTSLMDPGHRSRCVAYNSIIPHTCYPHGVVFLSAQVPSFTRLLLHNIQHCP
jgi:hypothetical protein